MSGYYRKGAVAGILQTISKAFQYKKKNEQERERTKTKCLGTFNVWGQEDRKLIMLFPRQEARSTNAMCCLSLKIQ